MLTTSVSVFFSRPNIQSTAFISNSEYISCNWWATATSISYWINSTSSKERKKQKKNMVDSYCTRSFWLLIVDCWCYNDWNAHFVAPFIFRVIATTSNWCCDFLVSVLVLVSPCDLRFWQICHCLSVDMLDASWWCRWFVYWLAAIIHKKCEGRCAPIGKHSFSVRIQLALCLCATT